MNGWATAPLTSRAHLVRERVDPRSLATTTYVGLEHIGAGSLSLRRTGSSDQVTSACFAFRQGDILFGRLRPYFRKVVRAPCDGVCTTEAWVLRPAAGVDPEFLFYALADPAFVALCARSAEGTRMPRARWDYVSSIPRSWPGTAEQRRIAEVLAPLDARIAVNRRLVSTLQGLLVAYHHAAAQGQPRPLGELATRHRNTVDPRTLSPETPCVGLADLPRGRVALTSWGRAADARSAKTTFRRGDLLFGRLRPHFKKVVIAPVDGVCSADILVLRPRDPRHVGLVLATLLDDPFIAYAVGRSTGTRMPRVSWASLSAWPVRVPAPGDRHRLEALGTPAVSAILNHLDLNRRLAQTRDRLLPGLLAGTVRPGH